MKRIQLRKVLDGALSLTLSALLVKILGVIYKVPLSYILGDEGMGYFNTAYTVYGFFYVLCSAGVPKAITCIVSERESSNASWAIYKYALRVFTAVGAVLSALFVLGAPITVRLISNTGALATLIVIGPSVLFVASGGVCRGYLAAKGRLSPIAISQVVEAVCKLVLGILFSRLGVMLGLGVELIAALAVLGISVGSGLSTLYLIIACKIVNRGKKAEQNIIINKRAMLRDLFKIAVPITLGSSVLTLSSVIDMTVTMRCLGLIGYDAVTANELYGNYTTLAVPMFNLVVSLVTPLTVYLLPELVKRRATGSSKEFEQELRRILAVTSALVAPCVCVYYFYSFDVLDVLFSSSQSARGFEMLSALSLSLYSLCMLNVINTAHEAKGKFGITILSLAVGTILKLIIEPVLILYTPLGALGVPLSTLISHLVSMLISGVALAFSNVRIKLLRILIVPALAAAVSFVLPYKLIYPIGGFWGRPYGVILLWVISTVGYFVLLFITVFITALPKTRVKIDKKSHFVGKIC